MHIVRRIERVISGNFGDWRSVGGAISEFRIDHGPGYRVDYTRRGKVVVILLCCGDKRTQTKGIRKAKEIAETSEDCG
ncbi:type II toxin-antitoxin system RelE/ParE family toxin [Bradyrhizobium macuxiense]|uniref:type II toxin-antitoxin system RelE/ParE family toxin n=1 Tax=Bradyrhizobium macuxiense TaxID=1755647 RepID=UPI001FDAC825|nr:type II toxin-antitoxin system RelE/ParE family toxin [Bradyrhizobium macuxiense]